ncbi:MAG: class I SAM-dependent methyltransferase [Clostridia bacterium]|nr:class I SAM-dependent methyltransferase [Clostridia bacterium]
MSRQWNALGVSHRFIKQQLPRGGIAIDATAGNGGDTLMLCETVGADGRVLAMDIQAQAVENTKKLLEDAGWSGIAQVVLDSHANLERYAQPESADCVVFNFGWLPGGDHNIFTRKESSLEAIEKGLRCLKPGGIMSLCVYYGRNNGYEERDAILEYVRGLDHRQFTVMVVDFANRINDPPIPIFIVKEG